jgi:hypothetical protein
MKKLVFIFAIAINGIASAQSSQESVTINQIVNTFESLNDMILTDEKLNDLYKSLSELKYNQSVLLTLDEYNKPETGHVYGNNTLFESTQFMNPGLNKLIRIEIDSSNITSVTRSNSNTQINISIIYRNESQTLVRTILNIHTRSGVIVWVYEMTNAPLEVAVVE